MLNANEKKSEQGGDEKSWDTWIWQSRRPRWETAVKERPVGGERMSHPDVWVPELGVGLACSGLRETASVAGTGPGRERVECGTREGSRARPRRPCGHPKAWVFPQNEVGKAGRHGRF